MDEHVSRAITVGLRLRGVDVLTAQEDARSGASDPALLDRATELGRVLFTQDDDLLVEAQRRQAGAVPFSGVIYGHQVVRPCGPYGLRLVGYFLWAANTPQPTKPARRSAGPSLKMLYRFQPSSRQLDHLPSITAASAGVTENDIEKALADKPETIFRVSGRDGPPVLVLKKSVRGVRTRRRHHIAQAQHGKTPGWPRSKLDRACRASRRLHEKPSKNPPEHLGQHKNVLPVVDRLGHSASLRRLRCAAPYAVAARQACVRSQPR